MKILEKTQDEIKNQILDAAYSRFAQYGMGKTTMAEIAKDCDMSAGNLYRYYENKTEIAAGCCQRCLGEQKVLFREIIQRPNLSPSQRLETFIVEMLQHLHAQFSQKPRLFELVMHVSQERMDLVEQHHKVLQSYLAEILAEGNKSGEFDVPDVLTSAEMILAATSRFNAPHFMSSFSLEQLEREAKGVVQLLISGLAKH